MGLEQAAQGIIPLPANCPSRAIVDVSENIRAKIYAIFCKIGQWSLFMIQCSSVEAEMLFNWICINFDDNNDDNDVDNDDDSPLRSVSGFIELPGINNEDHVTLSIIEHYYDLKLGEVWGEVLGKLL